MTITEFLLARVSEDEAAAWGAEDRMASDSTNCGWTTDMWGDDQPLGEPGYEYETHIVIHSPARVLAECKAKRAIVEAAREYSPELEHGDNGEWAFDLVLQQLAAVYSDHESYDPAWAV